MKTFFSLLIILLIRIAVSAQDTVIVYMDENFNQVEKQEAKYVRTAIIKDGHYFISDKNVKGQNVNYCEYKSVNPWIEDGFAKHYLEPDKLYSSGQYVDGKISGKWIYYRDNSTDTVDYSVIKGYTEDSDCSELKRLKTSKKASISAEKHIGAINNYVSESFCMPARTSSRTSYFDLDIFFILDTDGRIKCPEIKNTIDDDLSAEVLRILANYMEKDTILYPEPIAFKFKYNSESIDTKEDVYVIVEEMPLFKGGDLNNFRSYVAKNLRYPEEAAKNKIGGRVFVQFVVNSSGIVKDVIVVRGAHPALNAEAVRVIKSSPKWTLGKQRGKNVNVQFTFPVIFIYQ